MTRSSRLTYFALGFAALVLTGWISLESQSLASVLLGAPTSFDTQPSWFRALMFIVQWSPAIALAVLTAGRLARGWRVRPIAFGAGIAAAYLLAVGVLLGRPVVENYWHRQAFDAARWRRNERSNDRWPVRLTMVDDLLAHQLLRGLQRDSVVRLLGPGDSTAYSAAQDLVYLLGPERGMIAIDYELLVVDFAPDGRVIASRIART